MEPLTWSGALGPILNPIMLAALVVFALGFVGELHPDARRRPRWRGADQPRPHADHRPHAGGLRADGDEIRRLLFVACCAGYIIGGMLMPTMEAKGIIGAWPAG
jgi:peptide/nickel transport system permease protein